MRSKPTTTVKNLAVLLPKEQLEISKSDLTKVVKATESNELHINYTKVKGFMDLFISIVKEEFIKRSKKLKKKGERLTTDVGVISYAERHNYVFDSEAIAKFIKKHKIPEDSVYDYGYKLVTKNAKILSSLKDKGIITMEEKISAKKIEKLAEKYPSILKYVKDDVTEYVRGL